MKNGKKYIDDLTNQLKMVKEKQLEVLKEEEKQMPKLSFDLIGQIRQAYKTSKDDREVLKGLEDSTTTSKN
jgi:hypothetical protein